MSLLAKVRRFVGKRPALDHLTFTVYTRRECCCCHTAIELLNQARRKHRFHLKTVDVDTDPALVEAYGLGVPVVVLNGKVRFRGVVGPLLLERLLTGSLRNAR